MLSLAPSRVLVSIFLVLVCASAFAQTVTPATATVQEYDTQQFTASVPSTWKTSCGSISPAGLFRAPLYPSLTCEVTATATDGSGSAKANVTVVSPIVMTPVSAITPLGSTQQFTASAPVNWVARCGTITPGGLFTATAAIGTYCTVEGIATVAPLYTVYGYDKVSAPTTFAISPLNPTVSEGGAVQFTTNGTPTYAASCGTITPGGLFTAPLMATSCTVTATSATGMLASTVATVTSPLVIAPSSAATPSGLTQQFSANAAVVWAASCGSINAAGLYTASAPQGSVCIIGATASSGTAYTASVADTIAASPALTISPLSPTVSEAATQQFTSNVGATWAASCGSIGATTGLYTAPLRAGPCTVTATPVSGTGSATAAVTVTSPLVITPSSAATPTGLTQQFSANAAVLWAASCGSINAAGLYTASAPQGSVCIIGATASSGTAYTASVVDTIAAAPALTISPSSATLSEASTQQFTSNVGATWAASCGSIGATTGLYSAPLGVGPCTVTATPISGTGSATAAVTVTSPLTITPASASTPSGQTQQFTANMPATWASSCAGMNVLTGLFTPTATQGTVCTITATATGTIAYSATASDTIAASGALTVTPAPATVQEYGTQQFTASQPSTWKTSCGAISSTGLFTAPLYPSTTCVVTATATDGSGSAKANVTIVSPIVMTPVSAITPLGSTQQFTASAPVNWVARCGTITPGGLFTATAAIGTYCTVEGIATVAPLYTVYGYDKVSAPTTFAISPLNPTVSEGGTVQFTTNGTPTYAASCGTITPGGLFTAPLMATSCTVTATSATGMLASTVATVTSPLMIAPGNPSTGAGLTQQFSANAAVLWTASCGSINAAGLYTASAPQGSVCIIGATAATGTAYTSSVADTIAAAPPLTLSPLSPTVSEASTQQFTSNVAATWAASCGSIGATTGLYTAPLTTGSCTVTATPIYSTGTASAAVTVTTPLVITPSSAITVGGQTQQFTASQPASWASSCGGMNALTGLFTASATQGTVCTITATATGTIAYTATALDTIAAAGTLTVSPLQPTIAENSTQQFTSTVSASWVATCGTIDPVAGLFTASLSPGTCTVTANATDGSGQTTSTTVTVTSPITLTPATVNLHALNTQTFTASQDVTWTSSCGSITNAGVFTAPNTASTCTVTATATDRRNPGYTAQATAANDVVNQVRWRNDPGGTGLQSDELVLSPTNVNSTNMAQVWSATVDGGVWGQPLYMNAVTINGNPHNVLYVTTDNDSVYALDADTGAQLWKVSLIPSGATAITGTMVGSNSIPYIGVLGTPAIDGGALYVVAETAEQNATYFPHRLHALDITTGNELFGGPALISDPNLQPVLKLQRPGLTISNGTVYVAFGSLADTPPYHGLLFAFNETTLAETGVWNATPTGSEGGIWQAGGAPSVDSSGNVYLMTGNGSADGVSNFGESVVKLSPQLQLLDFFSPYNATALSDADLDLGSASAPVMPEKLGQFPHEMILCGKSPTVYVLNRDTMGGYNTTSDNIVQELTNIVGGTATGRAKGQSCFTTPSAWGDNIYFAANGDVLKQFSLDPNTGLLSAAPAYQGAFAYGWPGSQSMISSSGSTNGIIWTFDNVGKTLHADNASNVSLPLWVSPAIATGYLKWTTPTVINGHVYVGGLQTVVAFAPINQGP